MPFEFQQPQPLLNFPLRNISCCVTKQYHNESLGTFSTWHEHLGLISYILTSNFPVNLRFGTGVSAGTVSPDVGARSSRGDADAPPPADVEASP